MITRAYSFTNPRITTAAGALVQSVKPKTLQLGLDKSWAPFGQGTVALGAMSDAILSSIEPRQGVRFQTTATQTNDDGSIYSMPINMGVRSRTLAWGTGDSQLPIATDEALAQEYGFEQAIVYSDQVQKQSTAYANDAFTYMGAAITFPAGATPDALVYGNDAGCDQGQTLWDWASAIAEGAGAWVSFDEAGVLRWVPPTWAATTSTFTITGSTGVLDVSDTVSRDDPLFGNAAIVGYSGNSPTAYVSSFAGVNPRKTLLVTRARRKPAGNAATGIVARAQKRGRVLTVTALADLRCRPNQTWRVQWGGQDRTGTVQSVNFDLPNGLMTMLVNVTES